MILQYKNKNILLFEVEISLIKKDIVRIKENITLLYALYAILFVYLQKKVEKKWKEKGVEWYEYNTNGNWKFKTIFKKQ